MKKIFNRLMVVAVAIAMLGFAACDDENGTSNSNSNTEITAPESLAGTEWEGVFATYDQTPGYTQYPINIHWTIDFMEDGQGKIMFYLESPVFDPDPFDFDMTYTYDGKGNGNIARWEYGDGGNFTVNPYNRSITIENLTLEMGETEDSGYTYGGQTTLYQVR